MSSASRKILVPIKRVLDYALKVRVKPDETGVDLSNLKQSMNPFCEIAVEEALRLRDGAETRSTFDEVIAISIGTTSSKTSDTLRVALSMGVDRAIHLVSDEDVQPLAIAKLLKAIIEKEDAGLVIMGKQSIDGDNNQTGQMLAGILGWPQGTFASKVEVESDGKSVKVEREVDGGLEELSLKLPAIITCDLRLNEPRFVKLSNVMKAKRKKLESIDMKSLDVDTAPRIRTLSVTDPPKRTGGVIVQNVDSLINVLRNEAKAL